MADDPVLAVLGGALDAETTFAVAVRADGVVTEARAVRSARLELAALVERALREAGVAPAKVREVRVDRGPGSYVGLRVAVTFARTFAAFGAASLRAIESTAVAAAARCLAGGTEGRRVAVLLDGRQGRVQLAIHALSDGRVVELEAPGLHTDAEACARLRAGDLVLADAAALQRCSALAAQVGAACEALAPASAATLFARELDVPAVDPLALEPLYLTGSYVD